MFKGILISTLLVLGGLANAGIGTSPFGVGIVLIDPIGFSAKLHLPSLRGLTRRAVDAAIGWDKTTTYFHSTYLTEILLHKDKDFSMIGHYGAGFRLLLDKEKGDEKRSDGETYNGYSNKSEDEDHVGLRIPIGISAFFPKHGIEVFGEIGLVMDIIPETNLDSLLAVGARFYF